MSISTLFCSICAIIPLIHTNLQTYGISHRSFPCPKKGDLSLPANYRGISLMPIAAKIYNKLLLNQLIPFVGPILCKNHNGFRRGRSTLSQILCLLRLIEESNLSNLDLALVFIDFSKAFDSVDRSKMFEILEPYGIPNETIVAIKVMYTDTSSTILTTDGETPSFPILAGILQGDTLAPFLFIIVVDYVMHISVDTTSENGYQLRPKRSSRYPAEFLTDTDIADDIALISQSLEHAQDLLQSLEQVSNGVGLYLNETKTKCMNRCLLNNNKPVKTLNGTSLKQVEDYKYLGSFISSLDKDFNTRKGMAWSACNDMHKIWYSRLTNDFKIKIFRATIEPILLYGSETWTLQKAGGEIRWYLHPPSNESSKSILEVPSDHRTDLRKTPSCLYSCFNLGEYNLLVTAFAPIMR